MGVPEIVGSIAGIVTFVLLAEISQQYDKSWIILTLPLRMIPAFEVAISLILRKMWKKKFLQFNGFFHTMALTGLITTTLYPIFRNILLPNCPNFNFDLADAEYTDKTNYTAKDSKELRNFARKYFDAQPNKEEGNAVLTTYIIKDNEKGNIEFGGVPVTSLTFYDYQNAQSNYWSLDDVDFDQTDGDRPVFTRKNTPCNW